MNETKTTRKRLASQNVRSRWVKSTCDAIRYWLLKTASECAWSFERCLEWRKENIYDNPMWHRISRDEQAYISSRLDMVFEEHYRLLVATSVLDNDRLIHRLPQHEPRLRDNAFKIHEQSVAQPETHFGCYCWLIRWQGKLYAVPYRADEREKEFASGRLDKDDTPYFHRESYPVTIGHNRQRGELLPIAF